MGGDEPELRRALGARQHTTHWRPVSWTGARRPKVTRGSSAHKIVRRSDGLLGRLALSRHAGGEVGAALTLADP